MRTIKRWLDLGYVKRNLLIAICVGALICVFAILIQKIGVEGGYTKEILTYTFSVVASLLALYATYENSSREHALQYITNKRFDWLRDIRSLTSKLCGKMSLAEVYFDDWDNAADEKDNKYKKKLLFLKKVSEINEVMSCLYLYYNFCGERDHILLLLLKNLDKELDNMIQYIAAQRKEKPSKDDRKKILKLIEDHTQVYLKLEWERIKDETKYVGNIKHRSHFIKKKMVKQRLNLYEKKNRFENDFENVKLDDLAIGKIKSFWEKKSK